MIQDTLIELTPRCSLTASSARLFVGFVGATTFGLAVLCALRGMWPVLLFAGLGIALLAWAVRASMRAGSARETIAIDEHSITVRHGSPAGEHFSVFPRHGSAVKLHAPSTALHPSRLMLESRGQACEVGRFLTQDERRTLAARLKQLVGTDIEPPRFKEK
jgi:uncharacterized membrane protein